MRQRPDFVLRIPTGSTAGLHVFDAKFKSDGGAAASVGTNDILEMHAYSDVIPKVRSAWVLFPGSNCVRHADVGGEPSLGVGAFGVVPGGDLSELTAQLQALTACQGPG